jgi:hypothetical protein
LFVCLFVCLVGLSVGWLVGSFVHWLVAWLVEAAACLQYPNHSFCFAGNDHRLPAEQLYDLSKEELSENATLYIATDERNKTWFEPFKKHYDVVFLDDFLHVIPDVNTNYYGMIDQLVSYKSRVFYGTWWSTLSGYVNRMRGYYIAKHKREGWEDGTMQSYYFTPAERKLQMRTYIPVRKPIYCKEFAVAWRDIDKGIEELA